MKVMCSENDLYFKVACFYVSKTELFDRILPHKTSKYDKTEAIVAPELKHLSDNHAANVFTLCSKYVKLKTRYNFNRQFFFSCMNKERLTAQGWIDMYTYYLNNDDCVIVDLNKLYDYMIKNKLYI